MNLDTTEAVLEWVSTAAYGPGAHIETATYLAECVRVRRVYEDYKGEGGHIWECCAENSMRAAVEDK